MAGDGLHGVAQYPLDRARRTVTGLDLPALEVTPVIFEHQTEGPLGPWPFG
jgi:hypothetical protein